MIVISSSNALPDRAGAAELGIHAYFKKPYNYDEYMRLGEVVHNALQR